MGLSPPTSENNSHLKLWITDFGLARIEQDAGLTMTGDLLGTLRYMSPEQALAKRVVVDHRSDIYSLGVTLYELLTLQPAYTATDRQELLRQIAFEEPARPRQINPRIPQDLETIILKTIEKNPGDRYITAKEFADDLQRYLNIQPIQAKPITRLQQISRWVHRNTMVAALLSAIAVLSLAVAVVAAVGYFRTSAALSKAKVAEQKASEEAAVAQAINEFLQEDLLGLAGPEEQLQANFEPDADIKLTTLLDRALAKVDERFPDQPHIRVQIQETLAESLISIGRYDDAIRLRERILAYFQQEVGPEHAVTLSKMEELASVHQQFGQPTKAIELYKRLIKVCQSAPGSTDSDPKMLSLVMGLADSYRKGGQRKKAVALQEEGFQRIQKRFGPDHETTINAMNCLAVAYGSIGQHDKAIAIDERALELARKVDPEHPLIHGISTFLVHEYLGANQNDKIIALCEPTLELMRRVYGPSHPHTIEIAVHLGHAYSRSGQFDKAAELLEKAFETNRKILPDHKNTLYSANVLMALYINAGRFGDAVEVGKQAVETSAKIYGSEHSNTLMMQGNLASAYSADGQFDAAIGLQENVLALARKALGVRHTQTLTTMEILGWIYWEAGEFEKAEAMLAETLERRRKALGDSHSDTLHSLRLYSTACRSAGNIDRALALGRDLLHLRRQQKLTDADELARAQSELSATLLELQKWVEAESLLREALEVLSSIKEDDNIKLCAQCRLGASLRGQKRFAEAEPLLVQSYSLLKQKESRLGIMYKRSLTQAHNELVGLYEDWGKPDEANRWRQESDISAPY